MPFTPAMSARDSRGTEKVQGRRSRPRRSAAGYRPSPRGGRTRSPGLDPRGAGGLDRPSRAEQRARPAASGAPIGAASRGWSAPGAAPAKPHGNRRGLSHSCPFAVRPGHGRRPAVSARMRPGSREPGRARRSRGGSCAREGCLPRPVHPGPGSHPRAPRAHGPAGPEGAGPGLAHGAREGARHVRSRLRRPRRVPGGLPRRVLRGGAGAGGRRRVPRSGRRARRRGRGQDDRHGEDRRGPGAAAGGRGADDRLDRRPDQRVRGDLLERRGLPVGLLPAGEPGGGARGRGDRRGGARAVPGRRDGRRALDVVRGTLLRAHPLAQRVRRPWHGHRPRHRPAVLRDAPQPRDGRPARRREAPRDAGPRAHRRGEHADERPRLRERRPRHRPRRSQRPDRAAGHALELPRREGRLRRADRTSPHRCTRGRGVRRLRVL